MRFTSPRATGIAITATGPRRHRVPINAAKIPQTTANVQIKDFIDSSVNAGPDCLAPGNIAHNETKSKDIPHNTQETYETESQYQ